MEKLNYLTEEEAKMSKDEILLQIVLGLQTCKTKGKVIKLLEDVYEIGRRTRIKETDKNAK